MSDQPTAPEARHVDTALLVVALIAFLGLLGAYVGLVFAGKDPEGVIRLCVTLAGIFGVGAFQRVSAKRQDEKLDVIKQQTNGGLDRRIREGSAESMREILAEYGIQPAPTDAPTDKA